MDSVDRFFDGELLQLKLDSRAVTREAARELEQDVQRQIRRNFKSYSVAFMRGLKVHDYEGGSYVRLSPILSSHAEPTKIEGSPNLWILLPQGKKLGFKKIGAGFNWTTLKRRYGTRISFAKLNDGHVVLFKSSNGVVVPIYKIQQTVETKQRIEFYEKAEEIASSYGTTSRRDGRQVDFN